MEVITTHTNADFDTLGSMVAAKKLYPEARLVFPGSLERGLKAALTALPLPYEFEWAKDIDINQVTRLILVDIKTPGRIGAFADIIVTPGLDVHIYDHHPVSPDDIKGSLVMCQRYGSTTTLLTLILKQKQVRPDTSEATLMMAGIYEDTGSLRFPSTCVQDFEAAGYLMECGADLKTVTNLLEREITAEEIELLGELIRNEVTYSVGGVDVVIATVSSAEYSGEVSGLAHRLMDTERMECLFLLAAGKDRVHVVVRSVCVELDAGRVARSLGGGGHPQAASASLKGVTLLQAKEFVLKAIKEIVVPKTNAGEVMSAPPITTSPETTLAGAGKLMRRYNVNALPVVLSGAVQGVVTRQIVDKGVDHGLGREMVGEYMTTEVESVQVTSSMDEIREKVMVRGQRLLPVLEDEIIAGVITRSDLIKILQEELHETSLGEGAKQRSVASLMKERLPEWALTVLKDAGVVAAEMGYKAYVVGGFVRDLLLRQRNLDIDIVIEGDGIAFAKEFAARKGLKVKSHERFKTAVVVFPDGYKLDVATARLEYYDSPGALPTVELSSLKLDLFRRDFTINTFAAVLNPERFGRLLDYFGAQRDLKAGTIRVLHNMSFVEDPVRALRAVRFAERFDFRLAPLTKRLIKNLARLDFLSKASGSRVLDELRNVFIDDRAADAIKTLEELALLSQVHKKIKWDAKTQAMFERAREVVAWYHLLYTDEEAEEWLVLFMALTESLSQSELAILAVRLVVTGKKRLSVINNKKTAKRVLGLIGSTPDMEGSRLYSLLNPLPTELILYMMAKTEDEAAKKAISHFVTKLRAMKPLCGGGDLKKLGVEQGPLMGELTALLLKKKLDAEVNTKKDEMDFLKGYLEKQRQ